MFDLLMVSVIKKFIAKGVNLPGKGLDDVDVEVLHKASCETPMPWKNAR